MTRFASAVAFCLLSMVASFAESLPSSSPPAPLRGFVPPYEILRTVRSAGFEPLAPPLRQGSTYVVRAIDFRGVAMRVVVDARSGVIRDANRIVSGPGPYGPYAPGPVYYGRFGPPPPYLGPPDELYIGEVAPSEDEPRAASLHGPRSGVPTLIPAVPFPPPLPARLAPPA